MEDHNSPKTLSNSELLKLAEKFPPPQKWYEEEFVCPNCKEREQPCACERNKCRMCGASVGNITFAVCDDCWDK